MNNFRGKVTHSLRWNHNPPALECHVCWVWRLPSQHSSRRGSGRSQECRDLVLVTRASMDLIRRSLKDDDCIFWFGLPAEPQDRHVEVHGFVADCPFGF